MKIKLYQIALRFPKIVLILALLSTLWAIKASSKLNIETDMTGLLPQNTESVKNLGQLKNYFGGAGYLIVTLESQDVAMAQSFADVFNDRLQAHPSILYVDYKKPVDFFKKRLWLYLEMEDLKEIEWRVDRALELQKRGVSPTFSGMMDFADPEDRPDLTFQDIFEKYKKRAGTDLQERSGNDNFIILRVKIKDNSENLNESRKLMADVHQIEQDIRHDHPEYASVNIGYTGGYSTKLEQLDLIQHEVKVVSIVVSLLLFLILLFYFKRIESTLLIGIPLTLSLLWTGGLVYCFLGHLNMMTAFGASILGGLGSDYGIYLLTRYYQERSEGHSLKMACDQAFGSTGKATYGSMITMVAGFVALLLSKFGVFVEFGIVGALGLLTTYVGMMLIIPALLKVTENWKYPSALKLEKHLSRFPDFTKSLVFEKIFYPHQAFVGVLVIFVLCGVAVMTLPAQSKIFFEEGQMESPDLPGNKLGTRVNEVMGYTVDPTVLIAHGESQEEKLVTRINEILAQPAVGQESPVYNKVLGLSSFVPEQQLEKKKILSRIYSKLGQTTLLLKSTKDYFLETMQDSLKSSAVTRDNLPQEVKRLFESSRQKGIYSVFLFPSFARSDSESMKRYQDGVYDLKKKLGFMDMEIADGTFIASDTVRLIEREAPRGMMMVMLFFTLVLFVMLRSWTRGLMIVSNLLGSLFLLSGVLWLAGIHLNIMNIAVIPVVLGGGIDIYIHFSHRFDNQVDQMKNGYMMEIMQSEVPAMFVSSLTSMVGFGGFLLVSSSGLRSIGWVAVLGLGLVTLMAAFGFPRFLLVGSRKK